MNNVCHFITTFHIWSTKRNLQPSVVQNHTIHSYHEKGTGLSDLDPYSEFKKKYVDDRGIPWSLSNRKPERLREVLMEAEELLSQQRVVNISWKGLRSFQILLTTGILLHFKIALDSPDLEKLTIDKSLIGRLPDNIYQGVVRDNCMLFTCIDKHRLLLAHPTSKKLKETHEKREAEKHNLYDIKVTSIKLPSSGKRGVKKNVIVNKQMDKVCVWWAEVNNEAGTPWSPAALEGDRANIIIYTLTSISSVYSVDLLTFICSTGRLADCVFSLSQQCQLLTLEIYDTFSTKYKLQSCVYSMIDNQLVKVASVDIDIPAKHVSCLCRSHTQDRVALAYDHRKVGVWDEYNKKLLLTSASMQCTCMSWHPSDSIFIIASETAEIQVFDVALNCLYIQLYENHSPTPCLRLSQLFFTPPPLKYISWSCDYGLTSTSDTSCCCDDVIIFFDRGPLSVLRFELGVCTGGKVTPILLINEYIRYDQLSQAVSLLKTMNWNAYPDDCFQAITFITDHVFRQPFNQSNETMLEDVLGTFYAPDRPLTENTIIQYRDELGRLARKFFNVLLRYKRFEKAFLLAVDIGSKDLFMDIHYVACDVQNYELADACKERAYRIHHEQQPHDEGEEYDESVDILGDDLLQMRVTERNGNPLTRSYGNPSANKMNWYGDEDSDDDVDNVDDDPVAWVLANRTGHVIEDSELSTNYKRKDVQLVHFGDV